MACVECEERRRKLREAVLRGKIAEAAGHAVAGLREMVAPKGPASAEPGPLDQSIPDLTAYLADVDDVEYIDALIDAETDGKTRVGALEALNARRDELLGA